MSKLLGGLLMTGALVCADHAGRRSALGRRQWPFVVSGNLLAVAAMIALGAAC